MAGLMSRCWQGWFPLVASGSLPASGGRLHSWACDCLPPVSASMISRPSLLPRSFKNWTTQIVRNHLRISQSLTESHLQIPFLKSLSQVQALQN